MRPDNRSVTRKHSPVPEQQSSLHGQDRLDFDKCRDRLWPYLMCAIITIDDTDARHAQIDFRLHR